MDPEELAKIREQCGCWEEDGGCLEDFPMECPHRTECIEGGEDQQVVST